MSNILKTLFDTINNCLNVIYVNNFKAITFLRNDDLLFFMPVFFNFFLC